MDRQDDSLGVLAIDHSARRLMGNITELRQLQRQNLHASMQARRQEVTQSLFEGNLSMPWPADWVEYLLDAGERSVLFWDTLRQRADKMSGAVRIRRCGGCLKLLSGCVNRAMPSARKIRYWPGRGWLRAISLMRWTAGATFVMLQVSWHSTVFTVT